MAQDVSVGIGADNSQLLRVLQESKSAMTAFFTTVTEEGEGLGEVLEGLQGKFQNAFNFTGLALSVEGIKEFGEAIEQVAQQATQIHAMSEILGITTDQVQAMKAAAAEGGTSFESFTHAGERLTTMLTEARDGSGAAREKLFALGVTIDQIKDPTFNLNSLLQVLHDRLNDEATAPQTMAQLLKELGTRFASAAEAIKLYDGSFAGVKSKVSELNGLTEEQIKTLREMGIAVDEAKVRTSNFWSKMTAEIGEAWTALQKYMGVQQGIGVAKYADEEQPEYKQKDSGARQQQDLLNEMQQQELRNVEVGLAAFKDGTARKLEQLQIFYAATAAYYGSDSDKAVAAQQKVVAAQREYNEEQKRLADEYAAEMSAMYGRIAAGARAAMSSANKAITQNAADSAKEQEDAQEGPIDRQIAEIESLRQLNRISAKEELTEVTTLLNQKWQAQQQYFNKVEALYANDPAALGRVLAQEQAANQQHLTAITKAQETAARQIQQQWQFLTSSLSSGFSGAMKGILEGTETVGDAMRGIFTSVLDGIIGKLAQMAAEWVTNMVIVHTANTTNSAAQAVNYAGVAAAAAMASVAAIPVYGWALAPAVGAETYAEALAIGLPKAAGGWDIPGGVNPIAQLHGGEMVLPRSLADPMREMAAGSKRGGATFKVTRGGGNVSMAEDEFVKMAKHAYGKFRFS